MPCPTRCRWRSSQSPRPSLDATIDACIAKRMRGAVIVTSRRWHRHRYSGARRAGTAQRSAHHRPVEHGHCLAPSGDPPASGARRCRASRRRSRHLDAVRFARRVAAAQGPRQSILGISWFVSLGDKSDISANDLLQFWEYDDNTTVVAMYTESFGNPRKFARIARRVSRTSRSWPFAPEQQRPARWQAPCTSRPA